MWEVGDRHAPQLLRSSSEGYLTSPLLPATPRYSPLRGGGTDQRASTQIQIPRSKSCEGAREVEGRELTMCQRSSNTHAGTRGRISRKGGGRDGGRRGGGWAGEGG